MNKDLLKDFIGIHLRLTDAALRLIPGEPGAAIRRAGREILKAMDDAASEFLKAAEPVGKTRLSGGKTELERVDIE